MTATCVYFDTVKACFLCSYGGACKFIYKFFNFRDSKLSGHLIMQIRVRLKHYRRSGHQILLSRQAHWPIMVKLQKCRAAMFVNHLRQFAKTINIFVVVKAVSGPSCRVIDGRAFHNKKTYASSGQRFVKFESSLMHMKMVIVGVMSTRSGFYYSVPGPYRTDISGFKQFLKSCKATHYSFLLLCGCAV